MRISIQNKSDNPRNLIRRCGYGELRKSNGEVSYTKRFSGAEFPRFHAYIETMKDGFVINLHLDQKAACYQSVSAHSGEYEGEVVEQEGERFRNLLAS